MYSPDFPSVGGLNFSASASRSIPYIGTEAHPENKDKAKAINTNFLNI